MERYTGIRQTIEEMESRGEVFGSGLLREVYLENKYRVGFLWGETDVPRVPQVLRMFYFNNPSEFTVVTQHFSEKSEVERNREAMRHVVSQLPGDRLFLDLFLKDAAEIISRDNLRILSALEIANAADNDKRIVSIQYPKVISRAFGDEIATLVAASAQKLIPVPESIYDPNLPSN